MFAAFRILAVLLSLVPVTVAAEGRAGRVTESRILEEFGAGENWFLNGGNFRGEHFSALEAVNLRTVSRLGLSWSLDLPVVDGIAATPVVVDGVIYLSGPYSLVFAVDAGTGKLLWEYDPGVREALRENPYLSWPARSNRGVAVWDGYVLVATADCRLVALDAAEGDLAWSVETCDPEDGYGITDAPHVGGGKVFVGNLGSESGSRNRGYVSAYDVASGKRRWRFFTVPSANPDENLSPAMRLAADTWSGDAWQAYGGGGSAWNEMTYDPETNLLYFGTAGALPYVHALRSPGGGDNLFLASILAVNADTGEYVWHYQTVPEDSWEYNATMNIVLADLEIGDRLRKTLLIAPKNGFFYVLDRVTGEFLSAEKYARVSWASRINPETGRPVTLPEGRFWEGAPGETTALWPNMWGSHSWNPMAWHPELALAYIPAIDIPSMVTSLGDGNFSDTLELVEEVDGRGHSPGKLIAWDPVEQRARWTVAHRLPFNGGVLATGGGLVFQGTATGEFVAYDAATGELAWSKATGSAINAAPVTYKLNGTQYVLIAAGAGGGAQFVYPRLHAGPDAAGPARLLAFTLDGTEKLARPPQHARVAQDLPRASALPATVEHGKKLYAERCTACHGKNAVARAGGSVPDLRLVGPETHAVWNGIVIGGARRDRGMPSFEMTVEDAEAIRQYVLSVAHATSE